MKRLWLAAALACACGGAPEADGAATVDDSAAADTADFAAIDTILPPMPDIPRRRTGYLVATAVGALDSTWTWAFRAGRCARPPMIFMLPQGMGQNGASILLELPGDDFVGDYPVRFADSTGVPQPPAAQVGLQFFEEQRADAYQGADGVVTIERLDDTHVSGTFQVTVRHIVTDTRARIAGVFHDIGVEALPPDYCERMQAAHDSLRVGN